MPASTWSRVTPGLSPAATSRAGLGGKRIPALGFAARLAIFLRQRVVGMDLDAEFFAGKDDLDQKRRAASTARGRQAEPGEIAAKSWPSDLPA